MAVTAQTQVLSRSIPTAATRVDANRATAAYLAFLAFIATVYMSLPQLVPQLETLAPAKTIIAFAALAVGWACIMGQRRFHLGLIAGGGAFFVFFALVIASPMWSVWPRMSVDAAAESIKYLAAIVIAVNVLDTRKRIRTATAVIVLCSLFPAIGALFNYVSGAPLVEGDRASWIGAYMNPNFVAYYLVVSTPMALALRETTPKGSLARWAWLGVVGIFVAGVLVTGSRGGFLGLGAVVTLFLLRSFAKGKAAFGAAVVVGAALLLTPMSPLNRVDTMENLSGEVDASARGRIDAWRTAIRMIEANPILGVGAGAFVVGYEKYAPGDAGPARTAHNSFAIVAAELGLPALAVFIYGLIAAFRALGRAARRATPRAATVAVGVQTGLFGVCVCSLTGGYAFTWPLFFCLGLAAAIALREARPKVETRTA